MFRNVVRCYVCDRNQRRQAVAPLNGEDLIDHAVARRNRNNLPPLMYNEAARVCFPCRAILQENVRELEENPNRVRLNMVRGGCNNRVCFICRDNDNEHELHILSKESRMDVYVNRNIFIPSQAKCCLNHLDERGYILIHIQNELLYAVRPYLMDAQEMFAYMQTLRNFVETKGEKKFQEENNFQEQEFIKIFCISKAQFNNLFTYCDPVPDGDRRRFIYKQDLLLFLCKLHHGLSDDLLSIMFSYSSRQAVSMAFSNVRKSLMARFVPTYLGFRSITREQYIERHVTDFANILYNNEGADTAIIYIDGTYVYTPKSTNFQVLRQTYSVHKGRHLMKPVLLVAPDGYIVDIHGPYFADGKNNDAKILIAELEDQDHPISQWLQRGDIFILDQGYRDAIPCLNQRGIIHRMPPVLRRGERQLTTVEANEARLITKTRWIVESRNGHIKSMFQLLDRTLQLTHAKNLGDFYRICAALINAYKDAIHMQNETPALARQMLEQAQVENRMQRRVEEENLHRRARHDWVLINENHVPEFPVLNLEDLQELTFGVYQIGLAPSYIQDKLQRDNEEVLEFDERNREPGLLKTRICSRFRQATKYQQWISFEDNAIRSYYCTCKSGARTLGTCAHIASVAWYLGYARHTEEIRYPWTDLLDTTLDTAHRNSESEDSDEEDEDAI